MKDELPPEDNDWDKESQPPEITPVRYDPSVPRMIAIGSALLALPTLAFIIVILLRK